MTRNEKFGTLIINSFLTLTGGILYYNYKNLFRESEKNKTVYYCHQKNLIKKYKPLISKRTIIWLGQEIHKVNSEENILFVEQGDFISEGFELIPGVFSKTSGLVSISQKNTLIKRISIKSGLVYEGKNFKNQARKIYYPGEIIFSNITVKNLSFCEHIFGKNIDQLLVRPIEIYEFPNSSSKEININNQSTFKLESKAIYFYKSNQVIKGIKSLNLISNLLIFKINKSLNNNINLQLLNDRKNNSVNFRFIEKLCLKNYIPAYLKYTDIQSCFLIQENQFISSYMTLGYLEGNYTNFFRNS